MKALFFLLWVTIAAADSILVLPYTYVSINYTVPVSGQALLFACDVPVTISVEQNGSYQQGFLDGVLTTTFAASVDTGLCTIDFANTRRLYANVTYTVGPMPPAGISNTVIALILLGCAGVFIIIAGVACCCCSNMYRRYVPG